MAEEQELQSEVETKIVETEQNDTPEKEVVADSEPAEKVLTQEDVNKAINKKHFKQKEAERKAAELSRELETKEARLKEFETARANVDIPPMPDAFDDDYQSKVIARDDAIRKKAQAESFRQAEEQRQQDALIAQQQKQLAELDEKVKSYTKRVTDIGLDAAEMQTHENMVASYGVNPDVGQFLLGDANGPLMVKYLAENPLELTKIAEMPAINAALHLKTVIEPEAIKLKPKIPGAPPPADTMSGRSAGTEEEPLLKGAVFS